MSKITTNPSKTVVLVAKTSLLVLLSLSITQSIGQTLDVTSAKVRNEENQEIDGWVAHLDQSADFVEKTLAGFVKISSGLKTEKRSKNVWVAPKYKIEEVTPLRGDLRAVFNPEGNGTAIGFTFSPGYDIHLDKATYPKEYEKLEDFVKKFVKHHYTEFYKEESVKMEKEISSRKKEVEKYEKRIAKLRENINNNEQKISSGDSKADKLTDRNSKNKAEVEQLTADIEKLQSEIAHYQETLGQANTSMQKVRDF